MLESYRNLLNGHKLFYGSMQEDNQNQNNDIEQKKVGFVLYLQLTTGYELLQMAERLENQYEHHKEIVALLDEILRFENDIIQSISWVNNEIKEELLNFTTLIKDIIDDKKTVNFNILLINWKRYLSFINNFTYNDEDLSKALAKYIDSYQL